MARTIIKTTCTDVKASNYKIKTILLSNNYQLVNENGEIVWKCGIGFWTAMKYIKIVFDENNTIIISGWIKPMAGSEADLNGFVGGLPKRQVLNVIGQIQNSIC